MARPRRNGRTIRGPRLRPPTRQRLQQRPEQIQRVRVIGVQVQGPHECCLGLGRARAGNRWVEQTLGQPHVRCRIAWRPCRCLTMRCQRLHGVRTFEQAHRGHVGVHLRRAAYCGQRLIAACECSAEVPAGRDRIASAVRQDCQIVICWCMLPC